MTIDQVSALVDDLDENQIVITLEFAGTVQVFGDEINFANADRSKIISGDEWACLSVAQRGDYKVENAPRAIAYGTGTWDKIKVSV